MTKEIIMQVLRNYGGLNLYSEEVQDDVSDAILEAFDANNIVVQKGVVKGNKKPKEKTGEAKRP